MMRILLAIVGCLILSANVAPIFHPIRAQELNYRLVWTYEQPKRMQLVEWHPGGEMLAVAVENDIVILDAQSGSEIHSLRSAYLDRIADMAWNKDGTLFATGDEYGRMYIYNEDWEVVSTFFALWLTGIDWHPLKNELATVNDVETSIAAYSQRQITIWSVDGEILHTIKGLRHVINAKYSPDSTMLASIQWSLKGALWDAESYRAITSFYPADPRPAGLGDQNFVQSVAWNPDGNRFAILSNNNIEEIFSIIVWDVADKKHVIEVYGTDGFVNSLSWHNKLLASGWYGGWVRVWNMDTVEQVVTINTGEGIMVSVAWSPDGHYLAGVDVGGIVRLWEIDFPQ